MDKELAMVNLGELGTSVIALSGEMVDNINDLGPEYVHLLNRLRALTSRVVEVTDAEIKMEYDPDVAVKLMMIEIKEMIDDADSNGKVTKILPVSTMIQFKQLVDSILSGMETVAV